jgi:hypothetical protein
VDISQDSGSSRRRRAHSAAPPVVSEIDYSEESDYITSRVERRGRMGESWNGATRDWTIVDVPPGTERVRMDGVGGAATDVTWQRYNGVRRAKFIPERDGTVVSSSSAQASDTEIKIRDRGRDRERLSVQIYDKDREVDVDKVTDRRIVRAPAQPSKRNEMWTEITKDLVVREAIDQVGYDYEETEWFFYVMQYLRYVSFPDTQNAPFPLPPLVSPPSPPLSVPLFPFPSPSYIS